MVDQGSETETRELLGGTEENIAPSRGVIVLPGGLEFYPSDPLMFECLRPP